MNRRIAIIIISVFIFGLGLLLSFVPTKTEQDVCRPNVVDCGFDVGHTDRDIVRSYGLPFTSLKRITSYKYDSSLINSTAHTANIIETKGFIENLAIWYGLGVISLLVITKFWRNENFGH